MGNLIYEKKVVISYFSVSSMKLETKEELCLRVHTLRNDGIFNRYMVSFYDTEGVKTHEYIERLDFQQDAAQENFMEDLIATAVRLKTPYKKPTLIK